jgi:hypothetical protein
MSLALNLDRLAAWFIHRIHATLPAAWRRTVRDPEGIDHAIVRGGHNALLPFVN